MTALDFRVKNIVNQLDPEFRVPVVNALQNCDGTLLSFQQELAAQVWDMPGLPVQDIMDQVSYDVV